LAAVVGARPRVSALGDERSATLDADDGLVPDAATQLATRVPRRSAAVVTAEARRGKFIKHPHRPTAVPAARAPHLYSKKVIWVITAREEWRHGVERTPIRMATTAEIARLHGHRIGSGQRAAAIATHGGGSRRAPQRGPVPFFRLLPRQDLVIAARLARPKHSPSALASTFRYGGRGRVRRHRRYRAGSTAFRLLMNSLRRSIVSLSAFRHCKSL